MANKVTIQIAGGTAKVVNGVDTLGDAKKKAEVDDSKYSASVNGEPETDDSLELDDYSYVSFAPQVKGG